MDYASIGLPGGFLTSEATQGQLQYKWTYIYIWRLFTTKVDQNIRKKRIKRKHNHPNAEHTHAQRIHAHTYK